MTIRNKLLTAASALALTMAAPAAMAADESVFLDQEGTGNSATVKQGDSSDARAVIDQTGDSDELVVDQDQKDAYVDVDQGGHNAGSRTEIYQADDPDDSAENQTKTIVDQSASGGLIDVDQEAADGYVNVNQQSASYVDVNQGDSSEDAWVDVDQYDGSYSSEVYVTQNDGADFAEADIEQGGGANNVTSVTQGNNNDYAYVDQNGSGNYADVNQPEENDNHKANVYQDGNYNSATITQ